MVVKRSSRYGAAHISPPSEAWLAQKREAANQKLAGGIDFSELKGSDIFSSGTSDNLSDAYTQLMGKANEYGRLNRQLNEAGISTPGPIQELDTGVLSGGAPGPVRDFSQGNEIRRFIDFEPNEITGKKERVPFIDVSTGDALTQEFGMLDIDGNTVKANELVQLTALKLADMNARANNTVRGKEHYSDHIVDLDNGRQQRIEGKIRSSTGNFKNTDMIPIEGIRLNNSNLQGRAMSNRVAELISNKMKAENIDMISATEGLIGDGVFSPPGNMENRLGKILRSDPTYMKDPDGLYDSLIVTGYPSQLQVPSMNLRGSSGERTARQFKTDRLAVAPDNVMLVKHLAAAREWIKSGKGRNGVGDLKVMPNRGHNGQGQERAFVQAVLPIDGKYRNQPIYSNLAEDSPNVEQLLSKLNYIQEPASY